jgi:CVNH domain
MRCIPTLTILAVSFFPLNSGVWNSGAAVAAQDANPPGPYQQTCTDISTNKGNLYAKCQDEKGKSHSAKLSDYEKCGSEIVNKNGKLECAHAHAATALPPGPYKDSCTKVQMKGTTLHAVCKNFDGRGIESSLTEANSCSQGVINLNGFLNCQVNDVLPPGSYLATCKDVHVEGTTLHATCNNGKDQWLPAEMRDAHKCTGDIANQEGALRCTEIKKVERR